MNKVNSSYETADVILFIVSLGGILLSLVGAGGMILLDIFIANNGEELGVYTTYTTAAAIAFTGLCALPTCFISGRALIGRQSPSPRPVTTYWIATIGLLPITLTLGHLAFTQEVLPGLLGPLVHIITAAVPALFAVTIVRRSGPILSPRRNWGQFLAGLWAAPLISLMLEIVFLIPIVITLALTMLSTESGQALIQALANPDPLTTTLGDEIVMELIERPWVMLMIIGYIVLIVPIIEEMVKTIAIWPLLRRHLTPTEAFISGVLGGAGYALFEALFLTQPGFLWASTMVARIGATLMHSFTAGLASWGLAQAIREGKWRRFGLAFLAAAVMHALWNAIAVGIGMATMIDEAQLTALPPSLSGVIFLSGVVLLIALSGLALLGLIRVPQRLRRGTELEQAG